MAVNLTRMCHVPSPSSHALETSERLCPVDGNNAHSTPAPQISSMCPQHNSATDNLMKVKHPSQHHSSQAVLLMDSHQQNQSAAVALRRASNFTLIVCRAVPLWEYAGCLGRWGVVHSQLRNYRYMGISTWKMGHSSRLTLARSLLVAATSPHGHAGRSLTP